MDKPIYFPAKLLLFGEYSIINNSQALAIPFPQYTGHWRYGQPEEQKDLAQLVAYLFELEQKGQLLAPLDLPRFQKELNNNLVFHSTIPTGYGLGSSGALCAGIYHRFKKSNATEPEDFMQLKERLAQIESYFHGASSGTDPLVCYLNTALLLRGKATVQKLSLPPSLARTNYQIFLLDTRISRETETYVKIFLQRCEDHTYQQQIEEQLKPLVNQAIQHFVAGEASSLFACFHTISHFQRSAFAPMIPSPFVEAWEMGLTGELYKLKLCGAGGGGFILGMTNNFARTQEVLSAYTLIPAYAF